MNGFVKNIVNMQILTNNEITLHKINQNNAQLNYNISIVGINHINTNIIIDDNNLLLSVKHNH